MCGTVQFFSRFPYMLERSKEINMLFTIGIILVVLWFLGLVSSYTLGGFIYVSLVIGIILLILGFVRRGH
jgi:hypothetical protein